MKLALAISNHGIMLGGGEYSFLDFISHLARHWSGLAAVPCDGELSDKLRLRGIETHSIPLPPVRPWQIFNVLGALKTYLHLCRNRHPVLIYANGSRAAIYGSIVGKLKKLPVVWHCRIADRDPCLDYLLSKLSTRIVANSKTTAMRFNRKFQSKIRIVYNGIDLRWFQKHSLQKPELIGNTWRNILLVARVSKLKRHDLAISAFEQVAISHPNLHLICIGARDSSEPDWWSYLQKRSLGSSVADRIHWIGQIDDVRPWYYAADALIFPCENESFGRVLVEAMACGLPVIAARSGGVPEIVRHGKDGFLVTPGEEKEFTAAVNRILSDDVLRRRLGQSARQRAELFGLDTHVKIMLSVFDEVT
jgi:glycosyltransferase involved in cell wall biosynthesis